MFQKLLRTVFFLCICVSGLLGTAQPARAQKPLLYLHIAKPSGPLTIDLIKDFGPILAPFQEKLQANGYHVVTEPDTLRRLLARSPKAKFLYADVVCYQVAGSYPTVVFSVRDTLNKPWFVASEVVRMFISPQKAYNSAAQYVAQKLPATFTARFGQEAPANRTPQFMVYDNFQFVSYLESVLSAAPLRQQLKQGATLDLAIHVDELGFATLQGIDSQIPLDAAVRRALEDAMRNMPPWGPALHNGRRTAVDSHITLGRGKMPRPAAQ